MIPQVVASINKKDKSKVVSQLKHTRENNNDNGIDQSVIPESPEVFVYPVSLTDFLFGKNTSDLLITGFNRSPGLRAPPTV